MKNKSILISLFALLISCASFSASWVEKAPKFEDQGWRICHKDKDGQEKHLKGLCYISKECKKRFMRRTICRPKPLFCPWSDKSCLLEQALSGKRFMRRQNI